MGTNDGERAALLQGARSPAQQSAQNRSIGMDDPNHLLGAKTIGLVGSISFLVKKVYGPGVLVLPVALLNTGWFVVSLFNVLVYALSIIAALMLVEAISKIRGNANFECRVEFSTLALSYLDQPWANVARILFHATMILFNVCSIVICAQGMDNMLVWISGHTAALQVYPELTMERFDARGSNAINGLYSGELYRVGITLGYFLISLVAMPLGFLSLAESIWIQIVSFGFTVVTVGIFFVQFCRVLDEDTQGSEKYELDAFREGNYSLAVTATILSYNYAMFVPTWINEKSPSVPIKRSLWSVTTVAMVMNAVIGIACAMAYPHLKDRNVMQYLYENDETSDFLKVIILAFTFTVVLPGIPINAIAVRNNLYVTRLCDENWSFFWGSCFPFLFSWVFSNRETSVGVAMWTLLLTGGMVNFVLPVYFYYKARVAADEGKCITLVQDGLLAHGDPMVDAFFQCDPCTQRNHGANDANLGPLDDDALKLGDDASVIVAPTTDVPNEEAYVFEGQMCYVIWNNYGKVTVAMLVAFVTILLYSLYWRLEYEAHIEALNVTIS